MDIVRKQYPKAKVKVKNSMKEISIRDIVKILKEYILVSPELIKKIKKLEN